MSYDLTIKSSDSLESTEKESLIQFLRSLPQLSLDSDSHGRLSDAQKGTFAELDLVYQRKDESSRAAKKVNCIEVHIPAAHFSQHRGDVMKMCAHIARHLGWIVFDEQEGAPVDLQGLV